MKKIGIKMPRGIYIQDKMESFFCWPKWSHVFLIWKEIEIQRKSSTKGNWPLQWVPIRWPHQLLPCPKSNISINKSSFIMIPYKQWNQQSEEQLRRPRILTWMQTVWGSQGKYGLRAAARPRCSVCLSQEGQGLNPGAALHLFAEETLQPPQPPLSSQTPTSPTMNPSLLCTNHSSNSPILTHNTSKPNKSTEFGINITTTSPGATTLALTTLVLVSSLIHSCTMKIPLKSVWIQKIRRKSVLNQISHSLAFRTRQVA